MTIDTSNQWMAVASTYCDNCPSEHYDPDLTAILEQNRLKKILKYPDDEMILRAVEVYDKVCIDGDEKVCYDD